MLNNVRVWLWGVVAVLAVAGAVNLSSALAHWGGVPSLRLLWLHLVWSGVGAGLAFFIQSLREQSLEVASWRMHAAAVLAMAAVLAFGKTVAGNRNWIGIGSFGVQPSEFAKLTTVLVLAVCVAQVVQLHGYRWRDLIRPLGAVGVVLGAIFFQGDMGTLLLVSAISTTMLCVARIRWTVWVPVLLAGLLLAGTAYFTVLTPAQRARVTTFLHPEDDPRGKGYHVLQARIAIGSGGVWGTGLRNGTMNKLRFLPEQHTDFVFPVWAEEWGFAGGSLLLTAYAALLAVIVQIGRCAGSRFGLLLCVGVAALLFWQVTINIGGVLGLLPLTGVTLPFFSYGGSSTLTTYAALGLVAGVARRQYLFRG